MGEESGVCGQKGRQLCVLKQNKVVGLSARGLKIQCLKLGIMAKG